MISPVLLTSCSRGEQPRREHPLGRAAHAEERGAVFAGGDATDRARARAAPGGGGVGEADGVARRIAVQERRDERATEDVPRAGGIDGLDAETRLVDEPVAVEQYRSARAERHAHQAVVE